jgi:hypothetical protein
MKTHVIQLDSFDDFISIQDKLEWSKAARILIVWPDHGRIKLLDLDFQLLIRKAEYLGAQLAFVFDDPELLKTCNQFGVQVFSSIPEAQRRPWRRPKKIRRLLFQNIEKKPSAVLYDLRSKTVSKRPLINKWIRLVVFCLGLASFLVIGGLFIPSAKIYIKPKQETFNVSIKARSNPAISDVNLSGAIPAEIVTKTFDTFVEGESSGIIRIPSKNASGKVVFRNLTDHLITIPSGVIVRTVNDPIIRFSTNQEIVLEPGINSEKTVEVTSIVGGVVGNVPPGSIQAIEGDIGGNVMVSNENPIFGGVETKTFSPSESDYVSARQELIAMLNEKAYQEFKNLYPESYFLPIETLQLIDIVSEKYFPEVGEPGDHFKLETKAEFSIWKIDENDIRQIANNAISATMKNDFIISGDEVKIKITKEPYFDENSTLHWEFETSQLVKPNIDENLIFQLITGKEINEAIKILKQSYQLQANPKIEVLPSFWQRLPFISFRNQIIVED